MSPIFLFVIVLAIALPILNSLAGPANSRLLQKKFRAFGVFNGKTLTQFQAAIGKPSKTEFAGDDIIATWASKYYTMVIKFDKTGVFKQKVSEIVK